jgi:hypothetical protein
MPLALYQLLVAAPTPSRGRVTLNPDTTKG